MRLVRYQAAERTGVGAVRPDGSVVATPWPDFGALFAEPDPLRAASELDLPDREPVTVQRLLAPVTARGLTEETAMDAVFGFTIVNDVSAREVMVREKMQVMLSKSVDTFLPVGPQVVTKDEIPDLYDLEIATYLNGEVRQHSNTGLMTARVPQLLSAITRTITLHPGDIVTTGTPGGVGFFREPPEFMQPGDTIVAEVSQVGRLTNRVVRGW